MPDGRPPDAPTKDELVEWRLRTLETDVERVMEAIAPERLDRRYVTHEAAARDYLPRTEQTKAGELRISRGALLFAGVQTIVSVATLLTVVLSSGAGA